MSWTNVLTGVLRRGVKPAFATSTGLLAQQTRTAYVLRRKFRFPLHKKHGKPIKMSSRHFVYELEENTERTKHKPIDIILTQSIAGVGSKGEKLSVMPITAYNKYLLPGLAVYTSPDNLEKYKEIINKLKTEVPEYSSTAAPRTISILSSYLLTVFVNQHNPWTLQKFHLTAGFRKSYIHVTEEAITMPEREITGPDMDKENKEFYITVTLNKREQVKVRCRLRHYTNKESAKIPENEYWKHSAPAIFPEDQPILDSLPRHPLCENNNASV